VVRIHSPRPPSNKSGGIEYYRYEFWVGSWVGESGGLGWRSGKVRFVQARNAFRASVNSWSTRRRSPPM
jgi:hypothetical protein